MRVRTNRIYPYPVLSELASDYANNKFLVNSELDYDNVTATITLSVVIDDENIMNLLKNHIVGLYCLIECSTTKYREMFEVPSDKLDKYEINIQLSKLTETVEIVSELVAKEDINNYSNINLNEFMKDEVFNIPKYSIIGYTDTDEISIIKKIDINGDIPSIFSIVPDDEKNTMSFEINNDPISIFVPREQYDVYFAYRGENKRMKQMMIIIPVLVELLDLIKNEPTSYSGRGWYKVIEETFEKKGYTGFDDDKFKDKSSIELAQEILGTIVKDAMDEYDYLKKKEYEAR